MWLCKRPSSNQQHPAFFRYKQQKTKKHHRSGMFSMDIAIPQNLSWKLRGAGSNGFLKAPDWKNFIFVGFQSTTNQIIKWSADEPWSCQARCFFSDWPPSMKGHLLANYYLMIWYGYGAMVLELIGPSMAGLNMVPMLGSRNIPPKKPSKSLGCSPVPVEVSSVNVWSNPL